MVGGANGANFGMMLQYRFGLVDTGGALLAAKVLAPGPCGDYVLFLGM